MREFTIELIIHTKVMDNREEIKKCICHNHIILDEKYNNKTREELEEKEKYIYRKRNNTLYIYTSNKRDKWTRYIASINYFRIT